MNRVIALLKKIRLGQMLMAFLVGVLLIVSTACSSATQAKTPGEGKNPRPEVPNEAVTTPYQGGMNDFSDKDPRTKADPTAEKAKALIDNAEKNMIDQTGNLGENTKRILDKKGENVEQAGENLKQSAEDTKEKTKGAVSDVKQAAGDVKDSAVGATKQAVEGVKNNTLGATRDLTRGVNQKADDLSSSAKQAVENVKENTKAAGRDVVDKAQQTPETVQNKANQAAENTSNFFKDKVDQAARGTQRTLYKTGDAVGDAVD